jgi:hypothetical protein
MSLAEGLASARISPKELAPGSKQEMEQACLYTTSCKTRIGEGAWATAWGCDSPISQFVLRKPKETTTEKAVKRAKENTQKMLDFAKNTSCEDQWSFPCNYFVRYLECETDAAKPSRMLTWRRGVASNDYLFKNKTWELTPDQRNELRVCFWEQLREITEFLEKRLLLLLDFKLDNLLCVPEPTQSQSSFRAFRVLVIDLDQWVQTDAKFDPWEYVNGRRKPKPYGSLYCWVPSEFLPEVPASSSLFEMWRLCLSLSSIVEFCNVLFSQPPESLTSDAITYNGFFQDCQLLTRLAILSDAVAFLWFLRDGSLGRGKWDKYCKAQKELNLTDDAVTFALQENLKKAYEKLSFDAEVTLGSDDKALGSNVFCPKTEQGWKTLADNPPLLALNDEAANHIRNAVGDMKTELERYKSQGNLSSTFSQGLSSGPSTSKTSGSLSVP